MEGNVIRRARRGHLLTRSVAQLGAVVATTALTVVMPFASTDVWADGGINPVNCNQRPIAPECVVDVIQVGAASNPGGSGAVECQDLTGKAAPCFIQKYGWNGGDGCYYKPAGPDLVATLGPLPPPQAWYVGWCGDVRTGVSPLMRVRIFGSPPGQMLSVQEAVKLLRMPAPTIRVNPAPPSAQLVFVPTWLWVDPAAWGVRSATASVPGMSVTATGTPVTVTWSTGDGARVTCRGPGTAWTQTADPAAASPDCGHTYVRSSGAGMFTVSATMTWSVSWVGGGAAGTEPALTSTASTALKVAESQAVTTESR